MSVIATSVDPDKRGTHIDSIGDLLDALAAHRKAWNERSSNPTDEAYRDTSLSIGIDLGDDQYIPLRNTVMVNVVGSCVLIGDWPSR